jgi:molybdopterin molybdotransferase
MRPGKPLIHGRIDNIPLLGLPGNPVSSAVCANIFLRPAIARLCGGDHTPMMISARLAVDLPANDQRQDYLRATLAYDQQGQPAVTPARKQDSSMISIYAGANALIVRPPHDAPRKTGDPVMVMPLDPLL